jgi:hypothetical protein
MTMKLILLFTLIGGTVNLLAQSHPAYKLSKTVVKQDTLVKGRAIFFDEDTIGSTTLKTELLRYLPEIFLELLNAESPQQLVSKSVVSTGEIKKISNQRYQEFTNLKKSGYLINAVIFYNSTAGPRCQIKVESSSLIGSNTKTFGVYNFRQINGNWLFELLDPTPMQTASILMLKNTYLKEIFKFNRIDKELAAFTGISIDTPLNISELGVNLLTKSKNYSSLESYFNKFCSPLNFKTD